MRIIAGAAKGRRLKRPPPGTRPFTDRNREALFSSLAKAVEGAAVLDLFAGTGTLGLEALSRGAASATFVEWKPPAVAVLRENVARVGLGGEVVAESVFDFLLATGDSFDLVFVDPPYDLALASVEKVLEHLVNLINPNAIVMVHRRAGDDSPVPPSGLVLAWEREYGDARVMRFTPAEDESR